MTKPLDKQEHTTTVESIKESKRAEEVLLDSQNMLQLVLDSIPVRVFWKDLNSVYLGCNKRFAEDAGLESPEQIIGKSDFELSWSQQAELYRADDREVMQSGLSKLAYEEPQTWPDGTQLWLQTSKIPLKGLDGKIFGVMGVYEDITERKFAEEAIRESNQRLAEAQRIAHIGNWELDLVNNVLWWSDELYRIFKVDPQSFSVSYEAFLNLVHPDDRKQVDTVYRESIKNKKTYSTEYRLCTADGTIKHIKKYCENFYNAEGEPIRSAGTMQDITEYVQTKDELRRHRDHLEELVDERTAELHSAQEELLRKQRFAAIGRLTATVSHELRNPLGSIRNSLAVIQRLADRDNPMMKNALEIADRGISRCDNIISELLDFTRIRKLKLENTNIDAWLGEVLDEYLHLPEIEIVHKPGDAAETLCDREHLIRVVLNVLNNACDAVMTEEGLQGSARTPRVTVTTRSLDDSVEIAIADNGPGMSAQQQEKIFEPLFSTKSFGVGLGLSVVKQIMEQHGGSVKVESQVGHGTRVRLLLPLRYSGENDLFELIN